jgi:hypothetical protein
MPFTGRAIDPNDLELMRAAFNKVCDRLKLECRRETASFRATCTKLGTAWQAIGS